MVELRFQAILPSVDEAKLEEVKKGLGYFDLTRTTEPSQTLVARIEALAGDAAKRAERWRLWAPKLVGFFETLRRDDLDDRAVVMNDLYDAVRDSDDWEQTWPFPRPEPEPEEEFEPEDYFDEDPF